MTALLSHRAHAARARNTRVGAARAAIFAATIAAPAVMLAACASGGSVAAGEPRNEVSYLRGHYNTAYFHNHNESFRYSSAFHYHHGREHDVLQLSPTLDDHARVDSAFDAEVYAFTRDKRARTEPTMEMYGPHVGRMAWTVYRAIDWTHDLHEQTYDIMSDPGVPWDRKAEMTRRSVAYYLKENPDVARSIAPLDVTMRRAAVMMKPYFTLYRNYYPKSNNFAYVAHWWHPVAYEAMMIAGPDPAAQERALTEMNRTMFDRVFPDRPQRMLLSREDMPRYARMAPEAANAFDNLHMLHGIVYDILAYKGWTEAQKRAELDRVVKAMSYQRGDERYVRKFTTPHPDMDPRVYYDWQKPADQGEMPRIMREMMQEMMPMMMPAGMTPEMRERVMAQFKMKLAPGLEPGELPGSLHDAMMQLMPNMQMMPGSTEPGATPQMMVDAMLRGWQEKYGAMPDIAPYPMDTPPPPLAPLTVGARR